jgi:hypothetical protein
LHFAEDPSQDNEVPLPGNAKPLRFSDAHHQVLPDGSSLLFDPRTLETFAISQTAALVWERCDGTQDVDAIVSELFEAYAAPRHVIAEDVGKLLEHLASVGLVDLAPSTYESREPA